MTIVKALKALYERLGGAPSDVANATRAVEVLNAIAALYDGTDDATRITKAIANIAAVASGLIKPSGTKSITANGSGIDVAQYADVDVNVPQPSGTIEITGNGTGIDVADYATADVEVADLDAAKIATRRIDGSFSVDISYQDIQNFGAHAFHGCSYMSAFYYTATDPRYVCEYAFADCTALTTLDLQGFKRVYYNAFSGSGITTLYFSTDLQEFVNGGSGETVFGRATALTDIYYTGTQAQWETITGLSDAGIGAGVTVHYEYTPT